MKTTEDILEELLSETDRFPFIQEQDIPDINLYMDQVTGFLDEHLSGGKQHPEDRALTKTMINNYAKNRLLPAPEKKKYSREHMLLLIFIYYFKNLISLADIKTLFDPLTNQYFRAEEGKPNLSDIYRSILSVEEQNVRSLKPDIMDKFKRAASEMEKSPGSDEDREYLTLFAFVCELMLDVYAKKQIIELIADEMEKDNSETKNKKKKEKET